MEYYSIMDKRIDERILGTLQENAKMTTGKIAKRTGIPTTTVHNRIKRMERDGIIKRYVPVLDHVKLGNTIHALLFINAEHKTNQEQLAKKLLHVPAVQRVQIITGHYDLLVEVRSVDIHELNILITKTFHSIPGIEKTQTMIVLQEMER